MKRIFTLGLLGLFFTGRLIAQCVPDTSVTHSVPGIYPDSATGLPHSVVGIPYAATLQFFVPQDTIYLGLPAIIVSIDVTGVTGLPSGYSYTCTPTSCSFPGSSSGCIQIVNPSGPTVGQVGSYPLTVDLTIYGTIFGSPQTLPTTNDNYTLVIDNNTGVATITPLTFGVMQNKPNPFHGTTDITVSSPSAGNVSFKVMDLIGKVVYSKNVIVARGNNTISFSSAGLEPGIYLYMVSDGKSTLTRRLIVSDYR